MKQLARDNAERVFVMTRVKQREELTRSLEKEKPIECQEQDIRKNWVVNLSSHQLTSDERAILGKGFNFAPCPRRIPRVEFVAAIEPILRNEQDQERAERARAAVASILRNAKHHEPTPPGKNVER